MTSCNVCAWLNKMMWMFVCDCAGRAVARGWSIICTLFGGTSQAWQNSIAHAAIRPAFALSDLCNTSNSFPDIPWNYGRAPAWRGLLFLCVVFGTIASLFCVPFVNQQEANGTWKLYEGASECLWSLGVFISWCSRCYLLELIFDHSSNLTRAYDSEVGS